VRDSSAPRSFRLQAEDRLPAEGPIINALSVDVEDYFQVSAFERVVSRDTWTTFDSRVAANTHRLLDLFDETGVKATFFTLGWIASHHPGLVREIAARGHEIASHGYNHQLVYMLTPLQFREDVRAAKAALEDASGQQVIGFRAPSFSIVSASLWAFDILIEEGYQYDTSIFPIHHDRYGIPDAPRHMHTIARQAGTLLEMPASTVRIGSVNLPIAGGGYFRLFPYQFTRWGIRRVNTVDRAPVMFYMHPWEIDPEQPRIAAGAATRWRHYGGLHRTAMRLRRLVGDFRFDTVASVLNVSPRAAASDALSWSPSPPSLAIQ
jgi:polysaccharide deacetylase family protein (PEP-CTERM system associated)